METAEMKNMQNVEYILMDLKKKIWMGQLYDKINTICQRQSHKRKDRSRLTLKTLELLVINNNINVNKITIY